MISALIEESQNGNSDATLQMIEKFNPLLKKYAYKLYYEDSYNDLLVDFVELLHNINLDRIQDKGEGKMVSYLCKSINSSYIKKLTAIKKLHSCILYSELTENQMYYVNILSASTDEYFMRELPGIALLLTKPEFLTVKMLYCSGYTIAETAFVFGVSRQAVNQMKKRALKKLEALFLDKPVKEAKS